MVAHDHHYRYHLVHYGPYQWCDDVVAFLLLVKLFDAHDDRRSDSTMIPNPNDYQHEPPGFYSLFDSHRHWLFQMMIFEEIRKIKQKKLVIKNLLKIILEDPKKTVLFPYLQIWIFDENGINVVDNFFANIIIFVVHFLATVLNFVEHNWSLTWLYEWLAVYVVRVVYDFGCKTR